MRREPGRATLEGGMRLYICCCECSDAAWAPFDGDRLDPAMLFRDLGWILSVVSIPGAAAMAAQPEAKLAPVCDSCARELYPDNLRAAAAALLVPAAKA